MESPKYTLNKTDLKKVGKGALVAIGGALATYLASVISQFDFGTWTPIIVTVSSIAINFLLKLISGPSQVE